MLPAAVAQALEKAGSKANFVNRAQRFANRVRRLPGRRVYVAVSLAAILFATVAGAFGTGDMPVLKRLMFWACLIGLNTTLWVLWFAWRVRRQSDWWRAAGVGSVVINLPLPFEVILASRLADGSLGSAWPMIWVYAALLSVALLIVIAAVMPVRSQARQLPEFTKGALWRSGARQPDDVLMISAEDHYCRIFLPNGTNALVHGRFSELVDELAEADGLVVRRGTWVAARAVRAIKRNDRRWVIELNGRQVLVATSCVNALRERGWI